MQRLRSFLLHHGRMALCAAVLALTVKVLIPGGYMPERQGGTLLVLLCDGSGPTDTHRALAVALPAPGKTAKPDGSSNSACPYAALALPGLTPADSALLAAALAFILLLGMAGMPVARRAAPARLRPPLRGPPGLV